MPDKKYRICLAPKNEGLEYVDESDTYRFNVALRHGTWNVELPPTKVTGGVFSDSERDLILLRIRDYLSYVRWFGVLPRHYKVEFSQEMPPTPPREYSIRLLPDKHGVVYQDRSGEYHFRAQRSSAGWSVSLPPVTSDGSPALQFGTEERDRILPCVEEYLSHGVVAGFFPVRLRVKFTSGWGSMNRPFGVTGTFSDK